MIGRSEFTPDTVDLEGDVDDLRGDVIADVEQSADFDVQTGLFGHFTTEGFVQLFSWLDPAAGQRPGPDPVGVLVKQQHPPALEADAGHSGVHPATVTKVRPGTFVPLSPFLAGSPTMLKCGECGFSVDLIRVSFDLIGI